MRFISSIFLLIIVILGIIFAMLNHNRVQFNYLIGQKDMALSLLLAGTFFVGAIIGWLITLPATWRHKARIRQLRKQCELAQQEIKRQQ